MTRDTTPLATRGGVGAVSSHGDGGVSVVGAAGHAHARVPKRGALSAVVRSRAERTWRIDSALRAAWFAPPGNAVCKVPERANVDTLTAGE